MTYPHSEPASGEPTSHDPLDATVWLGSADSPPAVPNLGDQTLIASPVGPSYGPEFVSPPRTLSDTPPLPPSSPPPPQPPSPPPSAPPGPSTPKPARSSRRPLYVGLAALLVVALLAGVAVIGLPMLGPRRPAALADVFPSPLTRPELTVTQRGTVVSVRATADGNGSPATLTVRGCGLPEELMASGSGPLAVETRAEVQLAYSLTCTITASLASGRTFPSRAGTSAEQTITTTELPLLSPPTVTATVVNGNRIQVSSSANGAGESATLTVTGCGQTWTTAGIGTLTIIKEFLAGYDKTCTFKASLTSGPTNPQRPNPPDVETAPVTTNPPPPVYLWSRSNKPAPGRTGVYYANLTLTGYAPNSNVKCTLDLSDGVFTTTIRVNAQGAWGPSIPYDSRGDTVVFTSDDPNYGGAFGECVQA